jgi:hypothetical protein
MERQTPKQIRKTYNGEFDALHSGSLPHDSVSVVQVGNQANRQNPQKFSLARS